METKYIFQIILFGFLLTTFQAKSNLSELIKYVKSKYEHSFQNMPYLFYPAKEPKRLLILFDGGIPGRYLMWSKFWNTNEIWQDTSYLFLRDDTKRYYLGTKNENLIPIYKGIISHIIKECKLSPDQVFTYGVSMGGYAALFYGIEFQIKAAITVDPQTDYIWETFPTDTALQKISEKIENSARLPYLYVQSGFYEGDTKNFTALQGALARRKRKSLAILRRVEDKKHGECPIKVKTIEEIIYFFEKYDEQCLIKVTQQNMVEALS